MAQARKCRRRARDGWRRKAPRVEGADRLFTSRTASATSAAFERARSGSIEHAIEGGDRGVKGAEGSARRGGIQRPALARPSRRSGGARRESAPLPGLAFASRGPEPFGARPHVSPREGGAQRTQRERARGASLGTSGQAKVAAGAGSTIRTECSKRSVRSADVGSDASSKMACDAREHARARSWTRAVLARTTPGSRGDARIGREDERKGAGVSVHAVQKDGASRLDRTARKPCRARARRGSGPGIRDVPRAASAVDPETNVRMLGAWTRPL